jgi:anti-anti-sigma regulatory factor
MMVKFDASAGIRSALIIKEKIMKAINSGECVCDFTDLKRLDCALAQIVVSAMKEGRSRGIKVKIKGLSPEVTEQFMYCGIKIGSKT